jgi:hypothetical protein
MLYRGIEYSVVQGMERHHWKWAASVSGTKRGDQWVLAILGISITLYVYLEFIIPAKNGQHSLDRFGQPIAPENSITLRFSVFSGLACRAAIVGDLAA